MDRESNAYRIFKKTKTLLPLCQELLAPILKRGHKYLSVEERKCEESKSQHGAGQRLSELDGEESPSNSHSVVELNYSFSA